MVLDQNGVLQYSGASADIGAITRKIDALLLSPIERQSTSIRSFELLGNYPNPFNPQTQIMLNLDNPQTVRLKIFDIQGRLVQTLKDGFLESGTHIFRWDGRNADGRKVASGIYFYQLRGRSEIRTRRMILTQ